MNSDIRLAVSFRGHRKRKRLQLLLGPGSTDYLHRPVDCHGHDAPYRRLAGHG